MSGLAVFQRHPDQPNLWESIDSIYRYTVISGNLIIGKGSKAAATDIQGTITVHNWVNGQLGITLENTVLAASAPSHVFKGDQRAPVAGNGNFFVGLGRNYIQSGGGGDIIANTPYSIAAYACYSGATARFDSENRRCKAQKEKVHRSMRRSSGKTAYAHSMRLAGQKGLGRRMGAGVASARRIDRMTPGPHDATQITARNEALQ